MTRPELDEVIKMEGDGEKWEGWLVSWLVGGLFMGQTESVNQKAE